MTIGIKSGYIWGISRKRLVLALGEYYTNRNPDLLFDLLGKNTEKMRDKVMMNQTLDKLGIRHPKTYYYPFDNMPLSSEKCVIKYRFGSRGTHLTFTTFNKLDKHSLYYHNQYVQEFIPFEREYRVGVDFNRVLGIREKMGISRIKNSKSCFYETRDIPKLGKFAEKVARKFEVDFTGIDIGEWNGKYIVIELNSSPTIGDYWARLLAEDLINLLYKERSEK